MLKEEWDLLEREQALRNIISSEVRFPSSHKNDHCNRYRDILANEATRVHLPPPHDYINANHVRIYDCADNECSDANARSAVPFICTQAPLSNTIVDFYRMIVDKEAKAIVSLVNTYNGTQASRYFPAVAGDTLKMANKYHSVLITALEANALCNGAIIERVLQIRLQSLKNDEEPQSWTLSHFCFTHWPDRNIPSDVDALFLLIRQVRSLCGPQGLAVIHCSAGVGRTGVYVLLDYLLHHGRMNKSRPISLVRCIRSQRERMVQTFEQYCFIHNVWERSKGNEKKAQPNMKEASTLLSLPW